MDANFEDLVTEMCADGNVLIPEQSTQNVDEVKKLLELWKVEEMYDFFKDQHITIEVLKVMKIDHLKELLQNFKMGDKILFEFNFEKWRNEIDKPLGPSPIYTRCHNCSPNLFPSRSRSRSPAEGVIRDSTQGFQNTKIISLSTILNANNKTAFVKHFYTSYQKLDDAHRSILLNIIVQHFISNDIHMSLQLSYYLEKEILDLFPTEKISFYRTEKRGKLYTKYCYLKKNFNTNFLKSKAIEKENNSVSETIVPEEHAERIVRRIKYDNLSAEEFDSCWQACASYRIRQIKDKYQNIPEVFNEWPEYKKAHGYRLIDLDFKVLYPNHDDFLINWQQKVLKLFLYLKRNNILKEKSVKLILKSMSEDDIKEDETSFLFKTLWCLHGYLYPTNTTVKKDNNGQKNICRFTIKDSQESVVFVGQSLQMIDDHLDFLNKRGESIQPFILAIGDKSYAKFDQFILHLDGTKIPFNNFLRCLDICFKSFHIFNVNYPKAGTNFWTFIETFFYNISVSSNKTSKMHILMQELSN